MDRISEAVLRRGGTNFMAGPTFTRTVNDGNGMRRTVKDYAVISEEGHIACIASDPSWQDTIINALNNEVKRRQGREV